MIFFPELITERARATPTKVAYQFFQGATLVPVTLTYAALREQAASLAATLMKNGLGGQRVMILCKSQQHFVVAFFGCLMAGAIAVPTALPRRQQLEERLRVLARDAQIGAIVVDSDDVSLAHFPEELHISIQVDMRSHAARADLDALAAGWTAPALDAATPAFLQYTSGSTGDPKGVVVTHANLVQNSEAIRQGMGLSADSRVFTALPLFHDMGLIGGVLQSMYLGATAGCMAPAEFIQYPERWLQIMSQYKMTTSGGPNFMYELAARAVKPELLPGLDLSSWTLAFCGAEPIRPATISAFVERFAPYGFDAGAIYACYGMAEATLFITGAQRGRGLSTSEFEGRAVASCGHTTHDTRIEIVDPDTCTRVADGCVGEIWASGASMAHGYWQRPELSMQHFQAQLADGGNGGFLRTGDLGYRLDGQLYVTGRLKDMIISYGRKYAPQDVEYEAERSHASMREAGGAAFSVTRDGREKTVLVAEVTREYLRRADEMPRISSTVRGAVSAALGLTLDDVVFIKPGALPRTSSGKVRRSQCRADYLADSLQRVTLSTQPTH